MNVQVRLPALFADRIDGISRIDVAASSVEEALRAIASRYPPLKSLIVSRGNAINPLVVVFLNDRQLSADEIDRPVDDGDEIELVPAIEGGTRVG